MCVSVGRRMRARVDVGCVGQGTAGVLVWQTGDTQQQQRNPATVDNPQHPAAPRSTP
jgi:hypothetical protein